MRGQEENRHKFQGHFKLQVDFPGLDVSAITDSPWFTHMKTDPKKTNSAAHQDTAQTGWRCCWHTTLPGTSVPVPGHGDFPRAPAWRWEVSGWCRPPPGHPCSRRASPIHWSYLGSISPSKTEGFFLGDWKSKQRFCPETGGFPCIPQDCNLGVHYFRTNPFQNIKIFKSHKILSALMATCGSPEWYCRVFFTAETPPASMICAPFSGM